MLMNKPFSQWSRFELMSLHSTALNEVADMLNEFYPDHPRAHSGNGFGIQWGDRGVIIPLESVAPHIPELPEYASYWYIVKLWTRPILHLVCEEFGLNRDEFLEKERAAEYALAMMLAKCSGATNGR